jgi:hypothetical protein
MENESPALAVLKVKRYAYLREVETNRRKASASITPDERCQHNIGLLIAESQVRAIEKAIKNLTEE